MWRLKPDLLLFKTVPGTGDLLSKHALGISWSYYFFLIKLKEIVHHTRLPEAEEKWSVVCCLYLPGYYNKKIHKITTYLVSVKNEKRLTDHRTKGFCSIINFSFDLNKKHSILDFETKFAQIR